MLPFLTDEQIHEIVAAEEPLLVLERYVESIRPHVDAAIARGAIDPGITHQRCLHGYATRAGDRYSSDVALRIAQLMSEREIQQVGLLFGWEVCRAVCAHRDHKTMHWLAEASQTGLFADKVIRNIIADGELTILEKLLHQKAKDVNIFALTAMVNAGKQGDAKQVIGLAKYVLAAGAEDGDEEGNHKLAFQSLLKAIYVQKLRGNEAVAAIDQLVDVGCKIPAVRNGWSAIQQDAIAINDATVLAHLKSRGFDASWYDGNLAMGSSALGGVLQMRVFKERVTEDRHTDGLDWCLQEGHATVGFGGTALIHQALLSELPLVAATVVRHDPNWRDRASAREIYDVDYELQRSRTSEEMRNAVIDAERSGHADTVAASVGSRPRSKLKRSL